MARIHLIAYGSKEYEEVVDPSPEDALTYASRYPVVWLDILAPGKEEIQVLETVFGIDHLALEDIVRGQQRPKVEDYGGMTFMVLRIPKEDGIERSDQMSMFITKKIVITLHSERLGMIGDICSEIRAHSPWLVRGRSDRLAYTILDRVVDSYFTYIDSLGDNLETVEREVLYEKGRFSMRDIHDIRWDLAMVRRSVIHMRDMTTLMVRGSAPNISTDVRTHLRDVHDHILRQIDSIDAYREMLNSLTEIYMSNISMRINRIINILTVVSVIFLPLTLIASIYGMNFRVMPELGWEWGYPFALVLMLIVAVVTFYIIKRKGWLFLE